MIFKKITLKNFMSYANACVDFSGIHVACLSGQNGAGKSSLLDAITWTLWEEGRAKTDELIKLSKSEMSCEIEFLMEGNLYRVYRTRTKSFKNSQGKSNLEFQVMNPKDNEWTSLSLSSVRQTQELIIKTIKMDYETFINSVYLKQGKADEFTIKKPTERKQILADILGLNIYEKLCDSAKEKLRGINQYIQTEEVYINNIKEKIKSEDELKENLSQASTILSEKKRELDDIKIVLNNKEKELGEKREKEKQIQTLISSKNSHQSLIKALEEQLSGLKSKFVDYENIIKRKDTIEKNYNEFLKIKTESEKHEKLRELFDKYNHERNDLETALKEKISHIEREIAIYKSKLSERDLTNQSLKKSLSNESIFFKDFLPKSEIGIKEFTDLEEDLKRVENEGLELKHKKEIVLLDKKQINDMKSQIKENITTLQSHPSGDSCPLCKSPVTDKQSVIESYEAEIKDLDKKECDLNKSIEIIEKNLIEKRNEFTKTNEKISKYTKGIKEIVKELSKIKSEKIDTNALNNLDNKKAVAFLESQIEITKSEFKQRKEQIAIVENEIVSYKNEIGSLTQTLNNGDSIKKISERLFVIKNEITALNYNSELYHSFKEKLKNSEGTILDYNILQQSESEIIKTKKDLQEIENKTEQGKIELGNLDNLISQNKKDLEDLDSLKKELEIFKSKEREIFNSYSESKKELTIIEELLKSIEESKNLLNEKEASIKRFMTDKKHYETLEKAFSKNGIPVVIIDTVVPEIEKEANRILSRLTENQMHIALKTQREKKSSTGLLETLDVIIDDGIGTRNYELYSGGEAFKINFSLRLALSRLLANRAGAKLQSLIVDEGFGSQDASGRERLVEVIKSIQSEFELILVVTHLDELKEAFSTQIQVTKDEEGSKVVIAN